MSCRQHGYPWPSLATFPYHSSLLAGLQCYIPYPHLAAVCMFMLVVLLLLGHMRGSIWVISNGKWVQCFLSARFSPLNQIKLNLENASYKEKKDRSETQICIKEFGDRIMVKTKKNFCLCLYNHWCFLLLQ